MAEALAEQPVSPDGGSINPGESTRAGPPGRAGSQARMGLARARKSRTAFADDVWARTDPKYRTRAIVLLIVNFLLFCGLCMFSHWLHVAKPIDFSLSSYFEPLRFWGPQSTSLNDFILYPISVDQVPMHGIVLGLLMASIFSVPICVAILYRIWCAIPFLLAVLVFAHHPWMALTLAASCIFASVRPFRMSFRFGSALVGFLPIVLYLVFATRATSDQPLAISSPESRLLLAGPWALAILAGCAMCAVILLIARVVRYRPGAVAPVMAIMFAAPAILFSKYVGSDELTYRVLEGEFGPRSRRFEPTQDATERIREYLHRWTEPGAPGSTNRAALLGVWSESPQEQFLLKRRVVRKFTVDLLESRRAAYQSSAAFIADHPDSRYVANVLYLQARALDTRLDERRLVGTSLRRELYTDFPHVQSEAVWSALLTKNPDSPLAVAAAVRCAQLRLRRGDLDGALSALTHAHAPTSAPAANSLRGLLATAPPESTLNFDPQPFLFEAQRLRQLIEANRDDRYGGTPLRDLSGLDPHRAGYPEQLRVLAERYPDALLQDNIAVARAKAMQSRELQEDALREFIGQAHDGDALPEAMFEMADLVVQTPGPRNAELREEGIARLREVTQRFPQSVWARAAVERLRILDPRVAAAEEPSPP